MAPPILVTGGTGTLGRHLLPRLRDAGCAVRVLSRRDHPQKGRTEDGRTKDGRTEEGYEGGGAGAGDVAYVRGDLATGENVEAAVRGAPVVLHCASATKGDAEATRTLVEAASAQSPAPHVVYVSIVGVEDLSFGYFASKLAAERVVTDSGLPWTILRATQFYDLILKGARSAARLPLVPVPSGFLVQPVHPDEVAARLVELALAEPAGRVPDLAGPEVAEAADLVRAYLRARGRRGRVVPVRMPGLGRIRGGALLSKEGTGPGTAAEAHGRRTWEEFLTERVREAPPR